MKPEDMNYENLLEHHEGMIESLEKEREYLKRMRYISDAKVGRLVIIEQDLMYHRLIADACRKQTAKKPERLNAFKSIGKCRGCEKVISIRTASVYCQYCGNKVDWGNEE